MKNKPRSAVNGSRNAAALQRQSQAGKGPRKINKSSEDSPDSQALLVGEGNPGFDNDPARAFWPNSLKGITKTVEDARLPAFLEMSKECSDALFCGRAVKFRGLETVHLRWNTFSDKHRHELALVFLHWSECIRITIALKECALLRVDQAQRCSSAVLADSRN